MPYNFLTSWQAALGTCFPSRSRRSTSTTAGAPSDNRRSSSSASTPDEAFDSRDDEPWEHPYLTAENLRRFRDYSEQVWDFSQHHPDRTERPLEIAFCVNMAQNMAKWARLAQEHGVRATVFTHPMDNSALSAPEWEVFDGECADLLDREKFLRECGPLDPRVPCRSPLWDGTVFGQARADYLRHAQAAYLRLQAEAPSIRHEVMLANPEYSAYYPWARELQAYDVSYAASLPLASYLSGQPYCSFSVGGDLQIDCGKASVYGRILSWSFNASRFLMISNPHAVGHCRRLAFRNGIYLPYVMDDQRYAPGIGRARPAWEQRLGSGFYVLSTARIDRDVKGNGENVLDVLVRAAREQPCLRFVFLTWGKDTHSFRQLVDSRGLSSQTLFLPPVGKERLIDYYRSCDAVLDQFVYGYYGATALEAASVGKPILMRMRSEQYAPLYRGDIAPVVNCATGEELYRALVDLAEHPDRTLARGEATRDWLVRNHGQRRFLPILLSLLRVAADRVPLPEEFRNPLGDSLSEEEARYHRSRLRAAA